MGGEKFLVGLRGAETFFNCVSDRFSDPFSRFSNRFSYRFKNVSGANSFCTRAALTKTGHFGTNWETIPFSSHAALSIKISYLD